MPSKKKKLRTIRFDDRIAKTFASESTSKYLYHTEDTDELIAVEMSYGEMLEREEPGGFLKISENSYARRALNDELKRDGIVPRDASALRTRARWPMVSVRAGVNPSQKQELEQLWRKNGVVGNEVLPNGDVEWGSAASRRADLRARKMHDRDGFD